MDVPTINEVKVIENPMVHFSSVTDGKIVVGKCHWCAIGKMLKEQNPNRQHIIAKCDLCGSELVKGF